MCKIGKNPSVAVTDFCKQHIQYVASCACICVTVGCILTELSGFFRTKDKPQVRASVGWKVQSALRVMDTMLPAHKRIIHGKKIL